MTLAKTCHACNMMQDMEKAYCNHESFMNRDVSMFHCWKNWISFWHLK